MRLLLALLFLPMLVCGQSAQTVEMWREPDCYKHMAYLLTATKGKLNDTCDFAIAPAAKDIYIIKTDYIKSLPDTANGYHIHLVDADSSQKMLYKLQREQQTQVAIFYFAKWHHYLEYYQYWVMPVMAKKKKLQYGNQALKFHYFYRQDLSRFEFTKTECTSW